MVNVHHVAIVFAPNARSAWNRTRRSALDVARIAYIMCRPQRNHLLAQPAAAPYNRLMNNALIVNSSYVQNARQQLLRMMLSAPNVRQNLNMRVLNVM